MNLVNLKPIIKNNEESESIQRGLKWNEEKKQEWKLC